jgi:hypothetical protein
MEKKLDISRNSTDFPTRITKLLENYMLTGNEYDGLFYYQQWTRYYFEQALTKGFVINHYMGSGKTKTALAIIDTAIKHGIKKIIYIAPTALEGGLEREVEEYNALMKAQLDGELFKFIAKSYTVVKKISKQEDQELAFELDTVKTNKNIVEIKDKGLVVVDEAHLIMQSISNGSPGMVEFYDLLMNSPNINVIMLTGTIINSRPFELAPMLNIASGERIFPETEKTFMDAFWDRENKVMINKNKFQNRAMGLISRIDTDAIQLSIGANNKLEFRKVDGKEQSMFPELLEPLVVKVPMSGRQSGLYMIRREKELKDEMSKKSTKMGASNSTKFEKQDKESSTYMVRTRQCSNYAPPPEIEVLYSREGGYTQKDINEIMAKATPIELESPKFILIDQIIRNHKRQKGIIYSQFTDIGGNGAFSMYLQTPERKIESNANIENNPIKVNEYTCCGYQLLKFDKDKNPINLGPKTFALLNASVDNYDEIIKIYNMPENDHGELLPFLLVGTREGTGLDLKACRYVIVMEIYFIYSFFIQLLYRARRHGSHLRLDPKERDVQPYILLSVYPPKFTVDKYIRSQEMSSTLTNTQLEKGLAATTDERMYSIMMNNLRLVKPFDDACGEISIECSVLKKYFPDKICRTCAPNGMKLYTDLIKGQSPEKLLNYDLREADPCQNYETEKIEAKKITVKTSNGDIDYYYIDDTTSPSGYGIYYHNKEKGLYEELFPSSPAYQLVLTQIKK